MNAPAPAGAADAQAAAPGLDDAEWLALCIFDEARGEPDDGRAAVARVVINRAARRYASDGTIAGTVLWPAQFSGFWFEMQDGRYRRVCRLRSQAEARALAKHADAQAHPAAWGRCLQIAREMLAGTYTGGMAFEALGDEAVLYLNPDVLPRPLPAWAAPAHFLARIGRHWFYRA